MNAVWFNQGQGAVLAPPFGPRTHLRQARKESERKDEDPPAWALLDKCCDMGPLVDMNQWKDVSSMVQAAREEGGVVYQACNGGEPNLPTRQTCFFHPRSSQTSILPPRLSKRKYLGPSFVYRHFEPQGSYQACQQYPLRAWRIGLDGTCIPLP